MIKATTEHGTYYLIDDQRGLAKRVKAEGRNAMENDDEWFSFIYYCPIERTGWKHGPDGEIAVGKAIFFSVPRPFGGWRISTGVVSVEEV